MRNNLKTQILEIINTMTEAEDSLEQGILTGNTDILNVIADLQNTAIQIGNVIEESEGEGQASVSFIEKYCEALWHLYEKLNTGDFNCASEYNATKLALVEVQNSVEAIKVRKGVVFLPYNASMWDSLESVWKAASEDEECDVYVIPIPYYDKNSDGSFGQMHYEGDRFPKYVPITHFDEYSLEENHPDVIFIHNPYDEHNFVTSVHPFFYSKNLKQYTEKLVYIPYFVLSEINPDNRNQVDIMSHFCTVSAVVNSDLVIVQSEKMRRVYINVLSEFAGENTRKYWENKIKGLGSPKYDKIVGIDIRKENIPLEWQKLYIKSDNSRKKIILYNVSIKAVLENGELMLDKIEKVLRSFKDSSEKVTLLWRPHPLFRTTLLSMKPDLVDRYDRIIEDYIKEGWGIYDDSDEMDRAIALSDGYFGDKSSLVQLFLKLGKPVMMQNVNI